MRGNAESEQASYVVFSIAVSVSSESGATSSVSSLGAWSARTNYTSKSGGQNALRLLSHCEKFPLVVINVRIRLIGKLLPGRLSGEPQRKDVAWRAWDRGAMLICETTSPICRNEGKKGGRKKKKGGFSLSAYNPRLLCRRQWHSHQH